MSRLPSISGRECVQVLEKVGFYVKRQESSHIVLRRDTPFTQLTVPNHKTLDKGTLPGIIRQAGMTVDEFVSLL
jgi:predicted RNA binding protein YcfA (HicA-like mRNA interferase family)